MSLLYLAAACLVVAQILGIYALWTRKADVIFSTIMVALFVGAAAFGALDIYHRLH